MNFKVFKKLLISFLASIILLVSVMTRFATPVNAQLFGLPDTWYAPEFGSFVDRVYNEDNPEEIFGERYTHAQVVWIIHSITAIMIPEFILVCMTIDDLGDIGSCIASTLAAILPLVDNSQQNSSLATTIDSVTTKNPISGVGYLRGLAAKFHVVPEAQAQGFGYATLGVVQTIWVAVRDMAYFLMIFAFIIMAFMIMFRSKTSPQTVITVQSALPRLVLILILITFSYAIAGFVIDLAYLSVGLVAILGSTLSNLGPLELFNVLITSRPITHLFLIPIIAVVVLFGVPGALTALFGFGFLILAVGAILVFLIVIIWAVIMLRIIWLMLKTFINVVLLVVFAPILILVGVFPAAGGFGNWVRNLASHVMVFPAIIAMVFLAHFMFWTALVTGDPVGDTVSTVLTAAGLNAYDIPQGTQGDPIQLPGFSFGTGGLFGIVVTFGILFLIPSIGGIIQSLISGKPFSYGSAIGQAFGPASYLYGSTPVRATRDAMTSTNLGGRMVRAGQRVAKVRGLQSVGRGIQSGGERLENLRNKYS